MTTPKMPEPWYVNPYENLRILKEHILKEERRPTFERMVKSEATALADHVFHHLSLIHI